MAQWFNPSWRGLWPWVGAALVVIANTPDLIKNPNSLYFPLHISAVGIIACFVTSVYGIYFYRVDKLNKIEKSLKIQLFYSTILVLVILTGIGRYTLPLKWK